MPIVVAQVNTSNCAFTQGENGILATMIHRCLEYDYDTTNIETEKT